MLITIATAHIRNVVRWAVSGVACHTRISNVGVAPAKAPVAWPPSSTRFVPGEHPRAPLWNGRLRQNRLIERRCRATIASHAVEHPEECDWQEHRRVAGHT